MNGGRQAGNQVVFFCVWCDHDDDNDGGGSSGGGDSGSCSF